MIVYRDARSRMGMEDRVIGMRILLPFPRDGYKAITGSSKDLSHYCPKHRVLQVPRIEVKGSGINQMRMAVASPEKAGVGGSTPSLATILSIT